MSKLRLGIVILIYTLFIDVLNPVYAYHVYLSKHGEQQSASETKDTNLHELAEKGDTSRLNELIQIGADIEARNKYGETPLFTAVRFRKHDTVSLLIASGANVNVKNNDGTTPLMMAVLGVDLLLVEKLHDAGADVNAKDKDGDTVLMHGAMFGTRLSRRMLRVLVSNGADVNTAANNGRTALMLAVRGLSVRTLSLLISLGADANAKDREGLTALDYTKELRQQAPKWAARKLEHQMRQVLLSAGANGQ